MTKDGVWEKVVSVNDETREELGKMNWMAKQLTSDGSIDEVDEDGAANRRIRLGEYSQSHTTPIYLSIYLYLVVLLNDQ